MQKIKESDFSNLLKKFSRITDSTGDFLIDLGKAENKNPEYAKLISDISKDPNKITQIIDQLPQKYTTKFFGILIKLSIIAQKYKDLSISDEQKIEIGNQLKAISKELLELEN